MKRLREIAIALALLLPGWTSAQTTNLYHTNRVFRPIILTNIPNVTAYQVKTMAGQLTEVVGPTNILIDVNVTKAVEYEGAAWGYTSAQAAWTSAVAVHQSYYQEHPGMIYDNAGWVKGTRSVYGTWGAYLWYLQNHIAFTSSVTNVWISSQGVTNPILQVLVGSLGDYPPMTNVVEVGPTNGAALTGFPGAGSWTDAVYRASLDTYYEILIPDLRVIPRTNALLRTNIFVATSYPTRVTPTNYLFEIRRSSSTNWYTLTNGPASAVTSIVAVAGSFKMRVTVWVTNATATSMERDFTAQFPSYAEIAASTTVVARLDQAWASTLAATTPTARREEGFWIRVDTQAQQYDFTSTVVGPTVPVSSGATVQLGPRPADSPTNPAPNATATYTVASFHTHTPTTHWVPPDSRIVGPSPGDRYLDARDDVVGIVYDYVGYPMPPAYTNSYIPAGHVMGSTATLYHSGPERRTTP